MTSPSQRKGDNAERELVGILRDLTGWPVNRRYGAGARDDFGDLTGLPDTTIEVKSYTDVLRAIREGMDDLDVEQGHSQTTFGAVAMRRRGGKWMFVMDPDRFCTLLREATAPGSAAERRAS